MHKQTFWLIMLLVLTLTLSGCSGATPAATPTPTRTAMAQGMATTAPPLPTMTPTPQPSPTPPPAASATPFPADVNPLTGQKVADPTVLERIPLAIKVSNSAEARPQSGLSFANLVFEHLSEGNITRFTAVFWDQDPERVGSVRSGRLIDIEIPAMYGALFAYSGSSEGTKERIRASDLFPTYIAAPDFGMGAPYFYRVPQEGVAFEHTLFADPQALRELATERGINQRPTYTKYMAFSDTAPAGGQPASYLEVNYLAGYCTAEWTYDATTNRWLRKTAGVVHTDALTGKQLNAANVIVLFVNHVEAPYWEEMIGDSSRWKLSIEIQTWGSSPVLLFRDGQRYEGHWVRADRHEMLTFYDAANNPLPLKPGNTWFQVVPLETRAEEFKTGMWRFTP